VASRTLFPVGGRSLRRRVVAGLGSQGLSSISNFALVVVVARATSPQAFGAFAIAYSLVLLLIGGLRGAVGETLSVTLRHRSDGSAGMGAALLLGGAAGLVLAGLGALWPSEDLRPWFLTFAAGLPILALQDAGRFVGFATQRPGVAAISDGLWLTCQVGGWIALAFLGPVDGHAVVLVWWSAAGLAAAFALKMTGKPAVAAGWRWLRRHRAIASSFGSETVIALGGTQAAIYALGWFAGLPASGALRGAQSLYGPVRSFSTGVASVALPEAARRWSGQGRGQMLGYLRRVSIGLTAIAVGAAAVLSAFPDELGSALLDETWPAASSVMPAVGIGVVAGSVTVGAHLGLRAVKVTLALVVLRAVTTGLTVAAGVGGAAMGGLRGAAYGLAGAFVLTAVISWVVLLCAVARHGDIGACNTRRSSSA
jgi:O-antigen/teichoic acid export membrane protein